MSTNINRSILAWINSSNITTNAGIIGKGVWGCNNWGLWQVNNSLIRMEIKMGGCPNEKFRALFFGPISNNVWYFVAITIDRSGEMRMYINNNQIGYTNMSVFSGMNFDNGAHFNIASGYPGYFSGRIDEVYIYDRALSEAEIKAIYNATK